MNRPRPEKFIFFLAEGERAVESVEVRRTSSRDVAFEAEKKQFQLHRAKEQVERKSRY
jgi:hypothetical protein